MSIRKKQTVSNIQERLIEEKARLSADDEATSAFAAIKIKNKKPDIKPGKTFKKNKAEIECYRCKEKGHMAWQCPIKKTRKPKFDDGSLQSCAFVSTTKERACPDDMMSPTQ